MTMFRIKLIGCLDDSPSAAGELQEKISKEFGLSIETVGALFKRLPTVFKDNLSKTDAAHYCDILTSLGAKTELESISAKGSEVRQVEESSLSLSLVSTDFETGTIENLTIASEKSLSAPTDSLSFEFGDSDAEPSQTAVAPDIAAPSPSPTPPKIKSLSIVEELSELSLSDLDFEPSQKPQPQDTAPEIEQPTEELPTIGPEVAIEEEITPRDPYSTDLPVGKYQTEPFNEITDPLKSKPAEQPPADDSNRAFGKTLDAAFAASSSAEMPVKPVETALAKTPKIKTHYVAFAIIAIILAAIPLVFLSTKKGDSGVATTMFSQFESLLKQQKDIINGEVAPVEVIDTLPPQSYWTTTLQREQFSIEASLTMRGKHLNTISLILREQEPAKLTAKQIVDKEMEPLWLDRFDLAEDLNKNPLEAQALELKGRAYIRQRNTAIPARRVIAPIKITATPNTEMTELQLSWEVHYGAPTTDLVNKAILVDNQRLVARYTDTVTLTPKN